MLSKDGPEKDQLAEYREEADRALAQAALTADPMMRRGFLKLAAAWQELIRAAEGPLPGEMTEQQREKRSA